jgi:hypothetical protein
LTDRLGVKRALPLFVLCWRLAGQEADGTRLEPERRTQGFLAGVRAGGDRPKWRQRAIAFPFDIAVQPPLNGDAQNQTGRVPDDRIYPQF